MKNHLGNWGRNSVFFFWVKKEKRIEIVNGKEVTALAGGGGGKTAALLARTDTHWHWQTCCLSLAKADTALVELNLPMVIIYARGGGGRVAVICQKASSLLPLEFGHDVAKICILSGNCT